MAAGELTMRDVVARTGVEAATLRMWEQRHGFPVPSRTASGHRRYSMDDVRAIERVARARNGGLQLAAAIASVRETRAESPGERDSIFARLRSARPELTTHVLPKHRLLALSHAIEDECAGKATDAVLFASFQRERFYRLAERRWRDLSTCARHAVVLADFERVGEPAGAPVEVPIDRSDPAGREWSVICVDEAIAVLLAAWERPGQDGVGDSERSFEAVWSIEPELVHGGAEVARAIASRAAPRLAERIGTSLERMAVGPPRIDDLTALTNRMVAYVGGAMAPRAPRRAASA